MKGKVWLVGAGPGDPGLFTIKGKEILEQAEVVVFDRLVGQDILNMIPKKAEMYDAGKRAGNHTMAQEQINHLLVKKALEGKRVVRLKGGDPFLFGRGGEELELLMEQEIPFEIVPGVTSALAVPAYCGIPVTHRAYASSVHIITGHKKNGEALQLDFNSLVKLEGTLVFLMGASAITDICQGLIQAGMDPKEPAAVLQQGTGPEQKKIISDLGHLEEIIRRQEVATPAILVVGKVCVMANKFGWYEQKPLFGKTILVTRPRERSGTISGKLRSLGAKVLQVPVIHTEAIEGRLSEELQRLSEYQYLVFTSPAGVQVFFEKLRQKGKEICCPKKLRIAVIGMGTRREVERWGETCHLMPEIYDAKHLGIMLGEICKDEDKILIPRAEQGTPQLIEEIQKRTAAEIIDLPVYRTVYRKPPELTVVTQQIAEGKIDMFVFTSSSTVQGFAQALPGLDYGKLRAVCIGKQTEATAKSLGMRTMVSQKATVEDLVETCVNAAEGRQRWS